MSIRPTFLLMQIIMLLWLSACVTHPSLETRIEQAHMLASQYGWQSLELNSQPYPLQAFIPQQDLHTDTLTIYIEGDGLAWVSRRKASSNPTPANPIAFELALLDPNPAVYLARPCQYVPHTNCNQALWTSARFADAVIESSSLAIDQIKRRFSARRLRLIGYSGGAAIASLLAVRRKDVIQLVTVAGNLDHQAWTRHHRVSPLRESLNPADYWRALASIPQLHFIGEDDRNIGPFVIDAYLDHFPSEQKPPVHVVKNTDHYCCWPEHWPELLRTVYDSQ